MKRRMSVVQSALGEVCSLEWAGGSQVGTGRQRIVWAGLVPAAVVCANGQAAVAPHAVASLRLGLAAALGRHTRQDDTVPVFTHPGGFMWGEEPFWEDFQENICYCSCKNDPPNDIIHRDHDMDQPFINPVGSRPSAALKSDTVQTEQTV